MTRHASCKTFTVRLRHLTVSVAARLAIGAVIVAAWVATGVCARAEESVVDSMVGGHRANFHTTGDSSYRARHKNIADADVILVKAYAVLDDETGRAEIAALAGRARAGAKVFVQYDVKGTAHSVPSLMALTFRDEAHVPTHLQPLVDAGAVVIGTNKPKIGRVLRGRDHDKLFITWKAGQPVRVIMGGMNIGNPYAWSGPWRRRAQKGQTAFRDTDVELSGPKTKDIIDSFITAAERAGSPKVAALRTAVERIHGADGAFRSKPTGQNVQLEFLRSDPRDANDRGKIERKYVELIGKTPSGETVTISNGYFVPTKPIRDAMIAAAQRGVKFHLVANSMTVSEKAAQYTASALRDSLRGLYKQIPAEQLKVTEWDGNPDRNEGAIHQKIAKFGDGPDAPIIVGSASLDDLAVRENTETVVVMSHPRLAAQFDAIIARQLREGVTRRLDQRALRQDSFVQKAKSKWLNRVLPRFL